MDIGSYYSESINGFTKNPMLAVPALVGNIAIQVIGFLLGIIMFFLLGGFNYFSGYNYAPYAMNFPDLGTSLLILGIVLIVIVISAIISSFMYAATIGMSKKIVIGERPDLNDALKYGKKYLLKIFAVGIIFFILNIIAAIPVVLGIILLAIYPDNSLSILGIIIGGLISLILLIGIYLFFVFTYQSVVVDKKSIIGSFKDSFKLVRKNLLEVLVVLIINGLVIGTISLIVGFISLFLGIIPIIGAIFSIIIGIVVNTLILPYFTLVLTYLYMALKDEVPTYEYSETYKTDSS